MVRKLKMQRRKSKLISSGNQSIDVWKKARKRRRAPTRWCFFDFQIVFNVTPEGNVWSSDKIKARYLQIKLHHFFDKFWDWFRHSWNWWKLRHPCRIPLHFMEIWSWSALKESHKSMNDHKCYFNAKINLSILTDQEKFCG